VLYDALTRLGYNGDVPLYSCLSFQAHGLNRCEVKVDISLNPMAPWIGSIVGSEADDAVEKMAHVALTSLCESHIAATAAMPIALFPIHNQEDPEWQ
jgi:hypothetical protein